MAVKLSEDKNRVGPLYALFTTALGGIKVETIRTALRAAALTDKVNVSELSSLWEVWHLQPAVLRGRASFHGFYRPGAVL